METKVETLEDNRISVTVTVDAAEVDKRIKKTYKDFAQRYNFPGFRKGKAPRPVIDNALGAEAVLAAVSEDLVNDTYPLVIEEERIFPAGRPEFSDDASLVEGGKPYSFSFTVAVKPSYELSSYEPVTVELPEEGATEDEVEGQINALLSHYTSMEDASAATKLKPENYVDLTIKATDEEGEDIPSISTESRIYQPGSGAFSEAFDEEIMGIKKGQTRDFTLEIPVEEESVVLSSAAGKKVAFSVTCNVVKKEAAPKLTDEWVKETFGIETADELRKEIAESIEQEKGQALPRMKENQVLTELSERLQGEVPASAVEETEASLLQDFFTQLQRQGLTFDSYLSMLGITSDQFKEDVKQQAEDEAKRELALDAWARHFEIEATDDEVTAEFAAAGLEDPAATEKEWRESGRLYILREGISRNKALRDALDKAEVVAVTDKDDKKDAE